MSALFPAFLKLAGRDVLLVGAGKVARGKLEALLAAGARVRVVAPDVAADFPGVPVARRPFEPDDLDGVWFVVAAAPAEVNCQVAQAAEARRIFVNAVDDPTAGSAYTGGVLRRGGATIAVSTEGQAPALAGLLREGLEAVLPEDLDAWVATAADLRAGWKQEGVPVPNRRRLLLDALNRIYEPLDSARRERGRA